MRRAGIVIAATAALVLLGSCRPGANALSGPDAAIVAAAAWTAWLAATYLAAGVAVVAMTAKHEPSVGRWVPAGVRTLVRRAVGTGAVAAVISTGLTASAPAWADAHRPQPPTVSANWPLAARTTNAVVVVEPGDCLWTLAAQSLRRPAPARVAETWPRWWRANRGVIGSNPDLIHPGERLRPPAKSRRST